MGYIVRSFWIYALYAQKAIEFEMFKDEPTTALGFRYNDIAVQDYICAVAHIHFVIMIFRHNASANNKVLTLMSKARIVDTQFGKMGQGLRFISQLGEFQVNVIDCGNYIVRDISTGRYETDKRGITFHGLRDTLQWHNISSVYGLLGLV